MTTFRQLHVTYTSGRTRVVRTEPDTPEGRRAIDREAFERLLAANVAECHSRVTERIGSREVTR